MYGEKENKDKSDLAVFVRRNTKIVVVRTVPRLQE